MTHNISFTTAYLRKYFRWKCVIDHLVNYKGSNDVDWSDFTDYFLDEFKAHLLEEVSNNSVKTYCANIRSILNKYKNVVPLPFDDFASILSVKKTGVINTYLNLDEIQLLLNYKPENELEHTIWCQFLISCMTGMRHSDVIKLNKTKIVNGEIVYLAQKTKTVVHTIYCDIVQQLITEKKDTVYAQNTFNKHIKEICKKAGINSEVMLYRGGKEKVGEKHLFISSHDARRSFATNNYEVTKDIVLVSSLMGHSDTKMTEKYICNYQRDTQAIKGAYNQLKRAV